MSDWRIGSGEQNKCQSGVKSKKFNNLAVFVTECIYLSKTLNLTFSTVRTIILSEEKVMECAESVTSLSETRFIIFFCNP